MRAAVLARHPRGAASRTCRIRASSIRAMRSCKVTSTAICGSDLHLYDGYIPTMMRGDILGHEFMGEVVEVGPRRRRTCAVGDRVVVPFPIACGNCFFCERELYSLCENSNPERA